MAVLHGQLPGQRVRACPFLRPGGIASIPHLLPGDHDDPAVRSVQRLRGVKVEAAVHLADGFDLKPTEVEIQMAQHVEDRMDVLVEIARLGQVLGAGEQHLRARLGHEIVRALVHAVQPVEIRVEAGLGIDQVSHIGPVKQVLALEQAEIAPAFFFMLRRWLQGIGERSLVPGRGFPATPALQIPYARDQIVKAAPLKDAGITEILLIDFLRKHLRRQDRVARVFYKMVAVLRHREALALHHGLRRRVHQIQFAVLFHGGAGAAAAYELIGLVGIQGDGPLFPMDEILRGHVVPVHGPPFRLVGIVLVEEMGLSPEPDRSVRIVGPAKGHRNVVVGAITCGQCIFPPGGELRSVLNRT